MTTPSSDPLRASPGEDYGYDLVHQDLGAAIRDRNAEGHGAAPPAGDPDLGGDYGYDEAHDFRGGPSRT